MKIKLSELRKMILQEKEDYKAFFKGALKKFNITGIGQLKSDADKKEFFEYIKKNWKGKKQD